LADWLLAVAFFAVVTFAALPMGANRDWAWAPIAVIVGLIGGAIGGLYPALRAARLDAVEALSYE